MKEEWIAIAILRLVELEKCVVEGAGAAGLAAILAGHLDELKGKRFVKNMQLSKNLTSSCFINHCHIVKKRFGENVCVCVCVHV